MMDIKTEKLYKKFALSVDRLNLDDYFLCVYGSYASNNANPESDLDIFVATKSFSIKDFGKLRDSVIALHVQNNLKLDQEVPYENKLLIPYEDVYDALVLSPFVKEGSKYVVPPVKKDPDFLASRNVRLRLVLNALTTPHKYICGNKAKYTEFKEMAEKAIVQLATGLIGSENADVDEILTALLFGPDGEEGEMYLGYKKERPWIVEYLREIVTRVRFQASG